jgi:hypothetical protein
VQWQAQRTWVRIVKRSTLLFLAHSLFVVTTETPKPRCQKPGTDVMIFKIFSPKNLGTNWRFFNQNEAKF